jgi:hypothetical protein
MILKQKKFLGRICELKVVAKSGSESQFEVFYDNDKGEDWGVRTFKTFDEAMKVYKCFKVCWFW